MTSSIEFAVGMLGSGPTVVRTPNDEPRKHSCAGAPAASGRPGHERDTCRIQAQSLARGPVDGRLRLEPSRLLGREGEARSQSRAVGGDAGQSRRGVGHEAVREGQARERGRVRPGLHRRPSVEELAWPWAADRSAQPLRRRDPRRGNTCAPPASARSRRPAIEAHARHRRRPPSRYPGSSSLPSAGRTARRGPTSAHYPGRVIPKRRPLAARIDQTAQIEAEGHPAGRSARRRAAQDVVLRLRQRAQAGPMAGSRCSKMTIPPKTLVEPHARTRGNEY